MKQLFTPRQGQSFTFIFLSIILLIFLLPLYTSAEIVDKVVAVVNDDVITMSELEEEAAVLYRKIATSSSDMPLVEALEEARDHTLNRMIEQRLINQQAHKYNMAVTEQEIDSAYDKMRGGVSLSTTEFRQKLEESGTTEESYRNKLKSQILQNKILSYDVRSKVVITEEMVLDYYDENYTSRVDKGSFYLLQMGFSWDNGLDDPAKLAANKKETRKKADRVYNLVKNGQDFKKLAKQFSDLPSAVDGGDIGIFTLDDMAPAMNAAVSKLNPGELSVIIETPDGYQFFKLLSGDDNAIVVTATFEAVKEEIKEKLYQEKLKEAFSEWVKKLKESAYIQKL